MESCRNYQRNKLVLLDGIVLIRETSSHDDW